MAYVPQYVTSDVAPITIDMIAIFLAALAGQMGLLAQLTILIVIIGLIGGLFAAISGFIGSIKAFGSHRK